MTKEKLSYFAGLMDGEGCFNINHNKKRDTYQARLTMTNTNINLVNWCKDNIGGKIYKRKKYASHHKEKYEWMSWGDKEFLLQLLKSILPYLVGKKEQCKVLIKFQNTLRPKDNYNKLPKVIKMKRPRLYKEIKKLNSNGLATTE